MSIPYDYSFEVREHDHFQFSRTFQKTSFWHLFPSHRFHQKIKEIFIKNYHIYWEKIPVIWCVAQIHKIRCLRAMFEYVLNRAYFYISLEAHYFSILLSNFCSFIKLGKMPKISVFSKRQIWGILDKCPKWPKWVLKRTKKRLKRSDILEVAIKTFKKTNLASIILTRSLKNGFKCLEIWKKFCCFWTYFLTSLKHKIFFIYLIMSV